MSGKLSEAQNQIRLNKSDVDLSQNKSKEILSLKKSIKSKEDKIRDLTSELDQCVGDLKKYEQIASKSFFKNEPTVPTGKFLIDEKDAVELYNDAIDPFVEIGFRYNEILSILRK